MKRLQEAKKMDYHFQLDYFNNDDIPELFIFTGKNGLHFEGADVYTCYDGKLDRSWS